MKKNRVIGVITALLLCFSISIPSQAQSINGKARDRVIMQNGNSIQRIYQGQNVAFVYTHDISFHYDSAHVYTVEVEHGQNAAAYGNTLAATKGINVSSYTPYGAAGAWQLVGWKVGDVAANAAGVSNTIASTVNADLYAVWAKDCTSYFNFNGGSCTAWNSFGTDWYARGSAYYNNGNITPFSVKLPTVARANYTLTSITNNGAGSYAAGGTYNLTDKATFVAAWKANEVVLYQQTFNMSSAGVMEFRIDKTPSSGKRLQVTISSSNPDLNADNGTGPFASFHLNDEYYHRADYAGPVTMYGGTGTITYFYNRTVTWCKILSNKVGFGYITNTAPFTVTVKEIN